MTATEFRTIAQYVRDVGLSLQDYRLYGFSAQLELGPLQRTINRLHDVPAQARNSSVRTQVTNVEQTARKCTQIILRRNALEN